MTSRLGAVFGAAAALALVLMNAAWAGEGVPVSQGRLNSGVLTTNCFKTGSAAIPEVCADYHINWKIWTLMGEPVGDYNLAWTLTSLKIRNPDTGKTSSYGAGELPAALKTAAGRIELYIQAFAPVTSAAAGGAVGYHLFDTGTSVRAGAGNSVNTPGSPNWNRMFATSTGAVFGVCDDKHAPYLDAAAAKAAMAKGVRLGDAIILCGGTMVTELSTLEGRISELCDKPGANKTYRFCPVKKAKKAADPAANDIDNAFRKLEAAKGRPASGPTGVADGFARMEAQQAEQERLRVAAARAEQARIARHNQNVAFCENAIQQQQACFASSCGEKQAEKVGTGHCKDSELSDEQRRNARPGDSLILLPHCWTDYADNPRYGVWRACMQTSEQKCLMSTSARTVADCVAQREDLARRQTTTIPRPEEDPGALHGLTKKLHKTLQCDPKVSKCTRRKMTNAGGVRG